MTIYYLIPTYNEAQNIELLSNNLIRTLTTENKFYVFVDDNSNDNTIELIKKRFSSEQFKILEKDKQVGPGHSFNLGFEWILNNSKNDDDLIITMEADNTSDINILYQLVGNSNLGFSLVLSSVYAQGGGFDKTNLFRKIISLIANMVFRSVFNVKVLTLSSFYRVYKVSLIRKIKDQFNVIISENGFISMLEILIKAIKVNASIIEVPMILMSDKRKGKSKMKIIRNAISYLKFLFFKKLQQQKN